jgi:hypothetical protein
MIRIRLLLNRLLKQMTMTLNGHALQIISLVAERATCYDLRGASTPVICAGWNTSAFWRWS